MDRVFENRIFLKYENVLQSSLSLVTIIIIKEHFLGQGEGESVW